MIVYRLVENIADKKPSTYSAEHLLLSSELTVKFKANAFLRKASLTYLLTQDFSADGFLQPRVNCKYFSLDGPGKTFQSVKRGCVIDFDADNFAVMAQDKT